jgi:dTDP-4-dehydrorhamnose 3,5-epimerase
VDGLMTFEQIPIAGAWVVLLDPYRDNRGMFVRTFAGEEFARIGHSDPIAQVNHSTTLKKGAIRGMHYQVEPMAEIKIVRCLRGEVFDVIVDLRAGSQTFLQWYGLPLSAANMRMMYVPKGCAHGFQVLQPESELLYFHTAAYSPQYEKAVRYDDPSIGIRWPLPASDVSERDKSHPLLTKDFAGLAL